MDVMPARDTKTGVKPQQGNLCLMQFQRNHRAISQLTLLPSYCLLKDMTQYW